MRRTVSATSAAYLLVGQTLRLRGVIALIPLTTALYIAGCGGGSGGGGNVQPPASQTIAFATPAAQTIGTPLTLSATATSGLTVSFASSTTGVCTVSGSTATFLAAGTCSITASQAGDSAYAAATPVPVSFTVNPAALLQQTINFPTPATQTVGTPLALSATATSGLAVSFASTTTSVCTVSGATATFVAAGTCSITASQPGNSTYAAATPVPDSFTVNGATQTINFPNPAVQTVGTPLTLSATASSGLAVSFASTTTSVCTVSGSTVTLVAVGTCSITASQAGNTTYAAAPSVPASFTVNGETQTINFPTPATQTVGTPLTLSATASSGLAVGFHSNTVPVCTVSGSTATFVAAGSCTLTATQLGNSTYAAATPVTVGFTVSCGALTLTSFNPPTYWSHGNLLGINLPVTVDGSCFEAGDQFSLIFGQENPSLLTLPSGVSSQAASFGATLGSNVAVPMAIKTVDARAGGTPTSNAIYWLSLGDQNLGDFFSDGSWAHIGNNTATNKNTLYRFDTSGNLEASCPLVGTGSADLAVDRSTGNVGIGGTMVTTALDVQGDCTIVNSAGNDGKGGGASSSVALNGQYCATRPTVGLVSCFSESQLGAIPTSTDATKLAAVCGQPWSSVATNIAGRDTMIVFCREKTATTTTPSLVAIDMATLAIGSVAQLNNISTYSAMSAASTSANGWSTAGGWPMAFSNNLGVIGICSTYDNVCDFFNVATLTPAGVSSVSVPANTYRLASDDLNSRFVAAVGHAQAPVTTLITIDPMTGNTTTPTPTVGEQILGTLLVSNGNAIGADLKGQAYILK